MRMPDAGCRCEAGRRNPAHPGLNFKKVEEDNIYSVRVGLGYRAPGQMDGAEIVWFWDWSSRGL